MTKPFRSVTEADKRLRQEENLRNGLIRQELAHHMVLAAAASDLDGMTARQVLPAMYEVFGVDNQDFFYALQKARAQGTVKHGMTLLPELTDKTPQPPDPATILLTEQMNELHNSVMAVRKAAPGVREMVEASLQSTGLPAVELYAHTADEESTVTIPVELSHTRHSEG